MDINVSVAISGTSPQSVPPSLLGLVLPSAGCASNRRSVGAAMAAPAAGPPLRPQAGTHMKLGSNCIDGPGRINFACWNFGAGNFNVWDLRTEVRGNILDMPATVQLAQEVSPDTYAWLCDGEVWRGTCKSWVAPALCWPVRCNSLVSIALRL